jgi:hypothetical protein
MAALFPTSLYTASAPTLDPTLTQTEWNQIVYEVEALEAELGTTPSGTALTVATFLTALSTGAGLTATGHGALGTAATHPFSGLSGTFTAAQHGALGTAATHPFSGLTGTFTMAQHGGMTSTAASHGYTALTNIWADAVFVTINTGGSPGNTALVTIPAGKLAAAPTWGVLQEQYTGAYAVSAALQGLFVFGSVSQTPTQAHFRVSTLDGTNVTSGDHLCSVIVGV